MKRTLMQSVSAAMALALLAGPLAYAQPSPNHDNGDQHGAMQHQVPQHPAAPSHIVPSGGSMGMQHAAIPHNADHSMPYHAPQPQMHETMGMSHEGGDNHHWQHGDHYDGSRHVVSNWRYYHLHQPPAGYEWVQDGNQYVLIAISSGIIASVIISALNQ